MLQTMFQTLYQINKSNEAQREAAASAGASTSALLPPPTLAGENDNLPPTYDEAVQGEPKTTTTMTSAAIPPPPPPNVVTYQYVTAEAIPPHEIPDHMVMAVLATLCGCLPLGIVAIIKASDVKAQRAVGNRELAMRSSMAAKKWSWYAIVFGFIASFSYYFFYHALLQRIEEQETWDR